MIAQMIIFSLNRSPLKLFRNNRLFAYVFLSQAICVSIFFSPFGFKVIFDSSQCFHSIPTGLTVKTKQKYNYELLGFCFFCILLCGKTKLNTGFSLTINRCLHPLGCRGKSQKCIIAVCSTGLVGPLLLGIFFHNNSL